MPAESKINLLDVHQSLIGEGSSPILELFRLDKKTREIITFTYDCETVSVHYVEGPDGGYVHCNGNVDVSDQTDCVLCQALDDAEQRHLLPIYDPHSELVCVLAITPSCRPNALLPQLVAVLKKDAPQVVLLRRDGARYTVQALPLQPGMDDGTSAIADFKRRYDAGEIRLADVFARLPNDRLASMPTIAKSLAYRGKKK
jgi:hypothetical protein